MLCLLLQQGGVEEQCGVVPPGAPCPVSETCVRVPSALAFRSFIFGSSANHRAYRRSARGGWLAPSRAACAVQSAVQCNASACRLPLPAGAESHVTCGTLVLLYEGVKKVARVRVRARARQRQQAAARTPATVVTQTSQARGH